MHKNVTQILAESKLCRGMTEEQIVELLKSSITKLSVYQKNETIFREGEKSTKLYVLVEGKILIGKDTASGKRIIITSIEKEGDLFSEVYLFIERERYDMYAIATEKSVVLEISNQMFLMREENMNYIHIFIMKNLLKVFAEKAFMMNNKIKILGSGNLRERIVKFLFREEKIDGSINLSITREEMADYLGITRPSLSRELGKMQEEGIIQINAHSILILNRELFDVYL
ncbi:MAG TPA: Crp/Fnr family transcriptional regulator [Lachnospiraceae bacterium]|nr:Crp/Fnr family transcriptional regulator [Lachnospiraceae bacterium]